MGEIIVASNPKSGVSEAIKTIRTNIQFLGVDNPVKTILVTSPLSGEGKSYISSNLAAAYAQAGSKVLLIDCDMRCGRQHRIFDLDNERGLSNLLLDNVNKKFKEYIKKTEINNLSVLTMGVVPPNPTELLESKKCANLFEVLKSSYDIIILDGIPVLNLTDSLVLAGLADKIVIVSTYKQTPMELLKKAIKSLDNYKSKIAGVVLNKVPSSKSKYNNYYYNKYYTEE